MTDYKTKNDEAWEKLFEKYHIHECISSQGSFVISAGQIKEFREPRLMAKFDHEINLPDIFSKHNLSILPIARGKYIIAPMNAYHQLEPHENKPVKVSLPSHIQSINPYSISSEAVAVNSAFISGIFDNFIDDDELFPTVSGKMGSETFSFFISRSSNGSEKIQINVINSQIEIDAAFEGASSLSLIEAKCDISDDFLIRQLYYPFRLWSQKISKDIRLIFLVYSNSIFNLYEYRFENKSDYNSLVLIKYKCYSIEDIEIGITDIQEISDYIDTVPEPELPFPQADDFKRIINLCEHLSHEPLTRDDVTEKYAFNVRQTNYYTDAARYLGLLDKKSVSDGIQYNLTLDGSRILKLPHKQRQLEFVRSILRHPVFLKTLCRCFSEGNMPSNSEIVQIMKKSSLYRISAEKTYERRARTVRSWINWILELITDAE